MGCVFVDLGSHINANVSIDVLFSKLRLSDVDGINTGTYLKVTSKQTDPRNASATGAVCVTGVVECAGATQSALRTGVRRR